MTRRISGNACDPAALGPARRAYPELAYADRVSDAVRGADITLLLTDWPEFTRADPEVLGRLVARRIIVDGRNALNPACWRAAGWQYLGLGRGGPSRPQLWFLPGRPAAGRTAS